MDITAKFDIDRELKRWALDGARKALKVGKLHQIADRASESAIAQGAPVECEKGCSKCCHYRIDITQTEADILSEYTGRTRKTPDRPRDMFQEPIPCPFLVENQCTVYPVRPLQCRGYFALVPAAGSDLVSCRSASLADYRTARLHVLRPPQALVAALLGLEGASNRFADIRDYFPSVR
ncbi:MAG: YkgJ family cysteine cluster protein [Sulfuricella sp.]|nr:YkgJ family cysteine cluster protein [Sulfuricella sp.]